MFSSTLILEKLSVIVMSAIERDAGDADHARTAAPIEQSKAA